MRLRLLARRMLRRELPLPPALVDRLRLSLLHAAKRRRRRMRKLRARLCSCSERLLLQGRRWLRRKLLLLLRLRRVGTGRLRCKAG